MLTMICGGNDGTVTTAAAKAFASAAHHASRRPMSPSAAGRVGTGRPDLQSPLRRPCSTADLAGRRLMARSASAVMVSEGLTPRIHGDATKAQVRSLAGALSHFFSGLPVFFLAQSGLFRLVTFPFSPPN